MDQNKKKRLVLGDYDDDNGPWIDSIACTYTQSADCCQDQDESQCIKFETMDNGTGIFIRMSLPNGGFWSLDGKEELVRLLDDFQSRFESRDFVPGRTQETENS